MTTILDPFELGAECDDPESTITASEATRWCMSKYGNCHPSINKHIRRLESFGADGKRLIVAEGVTWDEALRMAGATVKDMVGIVEARQ